MMVEQISTGRIAHRSDAFSFLLAVSRRSAGREPPGALAAAMETARQNLLGFCPIGV